MLNNYVWGYKFFGQSRLKGFKNWIFCHSKTIQDLNGNINSREQSRQDIAIWVFFGLLIQQNVRSEAGHVPASLEFNKAGRTIIKIIELP